MSVINGCVHSPIPAGLTAGKLAASQASPPQLPCDRSELVPVGALADPGEAAAAAKALWVGRGLPLGTGPGAQGRLEPA